MPETIRTSVSVQVEGGPSMAAAPSIEVDAYDKISVAVDSEESPATGLSVNLQPDPKANIDLLLITSSRYAETGLDYDLGGETAIPLDGPQLFSGSGMLQLFSADPETMTIKNTLGATVTVSVLVGRSAG